MELNQNKFKILRLFNNKKVLLYSFILAIIFINTWSINHIYLSPKTGVKGIQTNKISKIQPRPSITPTPTSIHATPTIITPSKISSPKIQAVPQAKQYGGWYWRPELNKSQVWAGTDSAGKDIWTDGFPTPTATPTPIPQKSISSSGVTVSTSNAGSSEQKHGEGIGTSSYAIIKKQ